MAKYDNTLGNRHRTCLECMYPKENSEFGSDKLRCRECVKLISKRRDLMAQESLKREAAITLTKAIKEARSAKEVPNLPAIVSSFMKAVGGPERLGEMLGDDFRRVRGDHLSIEERMTKPPSDKYLLAYYQMLMRINGARDEQVSTADISQFNDDELKGILVSVAVQLVMDDSDFRHAVIQTVLHEDPHFFDRELSEASKVVVAPAIDNTKDVGE